ncbi:MAG: AMP-binding protein [Cyclobacteriaceae bacterium]
METLTQTSPSHIPQPTGENLTYLERFLHWENQMSDAPFLRQAAEGQWKIYSWRDAGLEARKMASAILAMGLPEKSNIALVSKNCAHWIITDLAIIMSGHVSVPFYPNLTADQLNHVLTHSDSKLLFVGKLDDWEHMQHGVPKSVGCISIPLGPTTGMEQWNDLIAQHAPVPEINIPSPEDLWTIVYTSGTTGSPKGVMLNHGSYIASSEAVRKVVDFTKARHRYFSYLPLCHIAERAIIGVGNYTSGGVISFAESLDTFLDNLKETRPTVFFGVPRIWTKFQLGVLSKMPEKKLNLLLKIPIINKKVRQKILDGLGLSEVEFAITGAAPCHSSIHKFYNSLGLYLHEAYGMSENSAVCSVMKEGAVKPGTVGQLYDGVEVKIDPQNGEVVMRSDWVMQGYYNEPEMTAEVLKDGWLHTGDMGELDKDGFLKITGRVKDTFKSAKGEYIVPGPIEWQFGMNNNIEQICLVGRELPQPMALIVLSEIGKSAPRQEVEQSLALAVSAINKDLVNYERVYNVVVVKEEWSTDNGILTPTMKIKRPKIEEHYSDKLQQWYDQKETVIWEG